jgi:hypothetical protein
VVLGEETRHLTKGVRPRRLFLFTRFDSHPLPQNVDIDKRWKEYKSRRLAERDCVANATKAAEDAKYRTWTSAREFTTKAKPLCYSNETITIETGESKKIKVPLEKLSEVDQDFVTKWRRQH